MNYIVKCPVCDDPIPGQDVAFCPNCYWEVMCIPETMPSALTDFYLQKLSNHRKMYEMLKISDKLRQELYIYTTRYGKSFIYTNSPYASRTQNIAWSFVATGFNQQTTLECRFSCSEIRKFLPENIVMLIRKGKMLQVTGEFDIAFKINTQNALAVNANTLQVEMGNLTLADGEYFAQFLSVLYKDRFLLFHNMNNRDLDATKFYWKNL